MNTLATTSPSLPATILRSAILDYEAMLSAHPDAVFGDTELCPLKHSFAGGIYVREIFIPAGTEIVGKIHRHTHPNFLMSGTVRVVTEEKGVETLTGPLAIISAAGTKRALLALTDIVWITVHEVGEERDLKKIEEMLIAPNYQELEETWPS